MKTPFENRTILLGVTGSIAAYKSAELASRLAQSGANVDVILTQSALQFVTPLTFQSVTGRRAYTDGDLWGSQGHVLHISLGKSAELLVIAPASANTLAKLAHGLADSLLTGTVLAARGAPLGARLGAVRFVRALRRRPHAGGARRSAHARPPPDRRGGRPDASQPGQPGQLDRRSGFGKPQARDAGRAQGDLERSGSEGGDDAARDAQRRRRRLEPGSGGSPARTVGADGPDRRGAGRIGPRRACRSAGRPAVA